MRFLLCLAAALFVGETFVSDLANTAAAQTQRYPRVYGPTGRPYGPTQAHYQYRKQYGRDWHGYGGISGSGTRGNVAYKYNLNLGQPHFVGNSFGYNSFAYQPWGCGFGGWGFPAYRYQSVQFFGPTVGVPQGYVGGDYVTGFGPYSDPALAFPQNSPGIQNPALLDLLRENDRQWNGPVDALDGPNVTQKLIKPSTPEAQLKSLKFLGQGDVYLRKLEYSKASSKYKFAAAAAKDLAPPHFHRAIAQMGLGRFEEAVKDIREGLRRDPAWPYGDASFDSILGEENITAKGVIKSRVLEWVQEDIRDRDRLFLMGAVLFLDDDETRARVFFETAAKLGGVDQALNAYLNPPAEVAALNESGSPKSSTNPESQSNTANENRRKSDVPLLPPQQGLFPTPSADPPPPAPVDETSAEVPKSDRRPYQPKLVVPPLPD